VVQCYHSIFEAQARRDPEAVAVSCGGERLSYGVLEARANRLARYLRARGVERDVAAGLYCERGIELMVAALAISKAGGAFVPIDAAMPHRRRDYILADAQVRLVLTQEKLAATLPPSLEAFRLDADWRRAAAQPAAPLPAAARPTDLAYILYTSGSTGEPKGAEILHHGLTNYLLWAAEAYDVAGGSGAPVTSSISFDATATSWFTPLLRGRTVTMIPDGEELESLAALLHSDAGLSLVKITPAHLEALRRLIPGDAPLRGVRAFVIGGEALFDSQLAFWRERAPHIRLFNEYGPTETVVGCCVFEATGLPAGDGAVPIGRPIANTELHILDEEMRLVRPGEPGELYIGGAGVARGYRGRAELTSQKFLANPFGPGRLYRTGDQVRELPDGNLVYLGRLDGQLKIRGYRIEPGEIEAALSTHPAVRECAVIAREEPGGGKRLAACVVGLAARDELARHLARALPPYMLPAEYLFLDAMPLTANGKIDRAALMAGGAASPSKASRSPRSTLELQLLRIWESVLGVRPIGTRDAFFEIGGHSLAALRLIDRVDRAIGVRLPVSAILEAPTVEQMARLIESRSLRRYRGTLVPIQPEGSRPPLFCVHGIGGAVLSYGHLARYLPDDQPFYALHARGIDGLDHPHTRVEDMAADYLRQIREVQPEGPYRLGGYSFGGLVAYEMARMLEARGERVAALILLDCAPQSAIRRLPRVQYYFAIAGRQVRRIRLHGGNLRRLSLAEKIDYVRRECRTLRRKLGNKVWQARYQTFETLGVPVPRELLDVKQAAYLAAAQYVPGPYSGSAILFRAGQHPCSLDDDPTLGWGKLVGGGVEVRVVPGDHNTIAVGENAAVLAREIMAALECATRVEPVLAY
jgi:amino acid adenylation domain-containing protein